MANPPEKAKRVEVRAPMSGVFYRQPAPEDPPYVEIGDTVKKSRYWHCLKPWKFSRKSSRLPTARLLKLYRRTKHRWKMTTWYWWSRWVDRRQDYTGACNVWIHRPDVQNHLLRFQVSACQVSGTNRIKNEWMKDGSRRVTHSLRNGMLRWIGII